MVIEESLLAEAKTCMEEGNTMRKEEAGRGDINYQSAKALSQIKCGQ